MTERRSLEWWIAIVRLLAIPFAVLQVSLTNGYPPGYEPYQACSICCSMSTDPPGVP